MKITGNIRIMDNIGTMETKKNLYKNFDESRKISIWTIGIMGTIGTFVTIRTLGTMGTKENGKNFKKKTLMIVEKYL